MSRDTIKLAIIGAGRIGRLHAEHLSRRIPGAELVVVADANEAAARDCAQSLGIPNWESTYQKAINHPEVQAIAICSPTDTHAVMIEAAAEAKKHIFCEKPIDFDLGRIDKALQIVRKSDVILQIGFNRRFDPNFQRVRQAVVKGEIGTPHQVHIISRDPAPPPLEYIAKSGGIFMDMTIHDFDMARFLSGDEVQEV
jgi:myo-inositol 2-dehydrogenase/D-chiro-inositol 1-dehydrogenase